MDNEFIEDADKTHYFVLHTWPDADAIGSSWIGTRFLFPLLFPGKILMPRFVSFNQVNPKVLLEATAVFDIGGDYNPQYLRFDHHHLKNPRSSCTTRMVWEYAQQVMNKKDISYLQPLVDLIEAGDCGELDARGYSMSITLGLHALLAGFRISAQDALLSKFTIPSASEESLIAMLDFQVLEYGWGLLDTLSYNLLSQHKVIESLQHHIFYMSEDRLVWGLYNSSYASVKAAFAAGAHLVLTSSQSKLPKSYTIEVWSTYSSPFAHVSDLLQRATEEALLEGDNAMHQELTLFYYEKTYAARGSPKAPNPNPLSIDTVKLIKMLDRLWQR